MTDHLFRQIIKHYACTTYDEYGKLSYDTYVNFRGRLQDLTSKEKNDALKDNIQADVKVYAPKDKTFAISDRLFYDDVYYEVMDIYNSRDGQGEIKFIKLMCKRLDNV